MEIENEINNNLNNEKKENNFLNTILGKTINNAFDIGLRAVLPNLIEEQVIDIKNALLESGLKSGIDTAINSTIDFGKSVAGIFTGNFENISQIRTAVGSGGIIDTISNVLDKAIDKVYEKGKINNTVSSLIKKGKDVILDNIENNIKEELDVQDNLLNSLEKNIKNWKVCYENKDFEGMSKEYEKIAEKSEKTIPIENILKETRKVETLHNLIKNNGQNFELTGVEKEIVEKIS